MRGRALAPALAAGFVLALAAPAVQAAQFIGPRPILDHLGPSSVTTMAANAEGDAVASWQGGPGAASGSSLRAGTTGRWSRPASFVAASAGVDAHGNATATWA